MHKYTKDEISKLYHSETHPILDEEDRLDEMSKDELINLSLFDNPEDYEELEYDDYEPDDYEDDVAVDDVVYALENKELEVTEEDLLKRQLKEKIKRCLPKATNQEIEQIAQHFIKVYGWKNLPFEALQQYIYGNFIRQIYNQKTFLEKCMLFMAIFSHNICQKLDKIKSICRNEIIKFKNKWFGKKFTDEYPKEYEETDFIYSDTNEDQYINDEDVPF